MGERPNPPHRCTGDRDNESLSFQSALLWFLRLICRSRSWRRGGVEIPVQRKARQHEVVERVGGRIVGRPQGRPLPSPPTPETVTCPFPSPRPWPWLVFRGGRSPLVEAAPARHHRHQLHAVHNPEAAGAARRPGVVPHLAGETGDSKTKTVDHKIIRHCAAPSSPCQFVMSATNPATRQIWRQMPISCWGQKAVDR